MSRKMMKFVSVSFVVGFAATVFLLSNFACAEVTLRVLVSEYPATRAQEELKHEFEQQTGIKVEYTFLPWEGTMNKVKLIVATRDSAYDVMAYDALMASIFLPMEGFEPLDSYVEDPNLPDINVDAFVPGVIDYYGLRDNQVVGVPFYYADRIAVYRKDWFEDAAEKANFMAKYGYELQYPRTWDQFRDVCEFFTRDTDGDGKIDMWGTTKGYMRMIIWDEWTDLYESFAPIEDGKWHVNDEMEPIFDNEKARQAVDYLVDITKSGFVKPGYMEMEWGDKPTAFTAGDVATVLIWDDALQDVEVSMKGKLHYAPLPKYEEQHTRLSAWMFAINKYSNHKEEAYRYLCWVTDPKVEKRMIMGETENRGIPARIDNYYDLEVVNEFPFLLAVAQSFEGGVPWPQFPEFEEMYSLVSIELQNAILGKKSSQQALDDAATGLRKIFERAGYYD